MCYIVAFCITLNNYLQDGAQAQVRNLPLRLGLITSIQRFPNAIFISVSKIEDKAAPRDFSRSHTILSSRMDNPEAAGSFSEVFSNIVASAFVKQIVNRFI